LQYFGDSWNETSNEEAIRKAQTLTIYVIVFSELLRSFTSRSLKFSSFSLNFWSNKYIPLAFISAAGLTVALGHIPGLMDVFQMSVLDGKAWAFIIGISFIPAIFDELFKLIARNTGLI
jgi:Ca2+-transporting ATPase